MQESDLRPAAAISQHLFPTDWSSEMTITLFKYSFNTTKVFKVDDLIVSLLALNSQCIILLTSCQFQTRSLQHSSRPSSTPLTQWLLARHPINTQLPQLTQTEDSMIIEISRLAQDILYKDDSVSDVPASVHSDSVEHHEIAIGTNELSFIRTSRAKAIQEDNFN